jgi:hypothetical protein
MRRIALPVLLSSAFALLNACGSEDDPVDQLGSDASAVQPPTGDAAISSDASITSDASAANDAGSGKPDATTQAEAGSDASAQPAGDGGMRNDAGTSGDAGSMGDAGPSSDAGSTGDAGSTLPKFSFFVTSLNAMRTLSKSENGFGGDLRFGETGDGAGLRGADKICAAAAEIGMKGASAKQWRAFLSTTTVNARTRIGEGPWYDRMGRLISMNLTGLLKERPEGSQAPIRDDLPNETGAPNRAGSALGTADDNHDTVTGTNTMGNWDNGNTCSDWTSTSGGGAMNGPRVGHTWPAQSGRNWMHAHRAPGCAPSVSLVQTGPGSGAGIGNGGGYGGIYCFALTP